MITVNSTLISFLKQSVIRVVNIVVQNITRSNMNRRDLIQRVLLGSTALVVMPSVLTSCTKESAPDMASDPGPGQSPGGSMITIDLSSPDNSSLNTAGGSKNVQRIIVINTGSGNFVALSTVCTHEGCTVVYDSGAGDIKCPCHGSVFSITGSVVNGPASSPLLSYPLSLTGNILTISL